MSFEVGSTLFESGRTSSKTHFDYLSENYIIFIVIPQRRMSSLAIYCGMHLSAFKEAQLSGKCGQTDFFLDEFTNSNARELALSLTVIRSFGGAVIMAAQSRSEMIRVFGERETEMIEDMCGVKHWFAFSSADEAEKISKAIGDTQYIENSFTTDSKELIHSTSMSLNKDRLISANELMTLSDNLCLTYIKGQGYFLHQKIHQSELNPHSKYLGDNPMEGKAFKPNFKVDLPL